MDFANFKCRFMSRNKKEVIYTDGQAITHPFQVGADPTHVKCNTPIWPLNGREKEIVKLDVTANGYDYSGNFDFLFSDALEIYRLKPLSGPNEGGTDVTLVGSGFTAQEDVMVKWGVVNLEMLDKQRLAQYLGAKYDIETDYASSIESIMPVHQRKIESQKVYDTLKMQSPKLSNWHKTHGGPVYLEIGAREDVDSPSGSDLGKYAYTTSFAEYYYYKQPVVKNIHPHGGPMEGGTEIIVEGSDFQFLPEYGVVPYCKIGDRVVEAKFESTVRIICPSPPGETVRTKLPIQISLNGEDFIDTGKFFQYYKNSEIQRIYPTSGANTGGTTIRLIGEHFTDISNPNEFLCRFKPLNKDIPPKYISARYFNQTTILCASPGGFGNVDAVNVDVSFNGIDYTNSGKVFRYYNIITAHPRSGPADGVGENIKVIGQGFQDDGNVKCRLDNIEYQPNHINWDEISCPVLAAKQGKDFFGNVPFEVSVNGEDWHQFTGGFQYYEQPTVKDIYPKHGPNVGHGKIKFYGDKFRSDFQLAEVYCKVGDSYGKAKVIDSKTMECEISELPLTGKENAFPAQVSLNNASWTQPNKNTYYTPYGIHHITPNSGPADGGTEITVVGSGFINSGEAKCRFGVPGDYAIVSGKVLSSDKMICKSPVGFQLPKQASYPFSVPFSIAFNKDEYDPWTQSAHRFRFYKQPIIKYCNPDHSEIGHIQEVYVYASEDSEFIQPIPIEGSQYTDYGIFCKFGKYGSTPGVMVNSTLVKCVTPTIQDRPENIDKDTVVLSVAQNGQNFNENDSGCDYTFTGTGAGASFWPWILALILIFILLIACLLCIAAFLQRRAMRKPTRAMGANKESENPHIINRRPRGVPYGHMEYDIGTNVQQDALFRERQDFYGDDRYDPHSMRGGY